ncbi:dinitrogenase iron-molybdenum cofactor [Thermococcus sp. MV5]|uniref:NifB/NifX family molybdenum-iron cluster-binding protein n=1 Tax=Thermococcus sp. MV5 TaxID=1638272 RepID=UPI0014395009|nr:NifB/NifX family molybdenum-iron cluster-binding protein [Thermococcus sp. MV5]NJE25105.1 dinitrogenase iron-molybdenum cofactor [Thermococcus sp. MV5]
MRIGISSSTNGGLEDTIAPVFARAPVFTIVDVENGEIKNVRVLQNQAAYAGGGAGPIAVQTLINEGVDTIIASQIGPNAMSAIQAAGIKYYTFPAGTSIKEAVDRIIKGETPSPASEFPQAPSYPPVQVPSQNPQYYPPIPPYPAYGFGWGGGRGRGIGRGFGRGWGRGGRGWGARLGYCPWTGMPNRRNRIARYFGWW